MFSLRRFLITALAVTLSLAGNAEEKTTGFLDVESVPHDISKTCREGVARLYDECSDQYVVLRQATSRAAETGKSVLIVYGAEWCIWCHVFDKYVRGHSRLFNYRYEYDNEPQRWLMLELENKNAEEEALQLNNFVARNFVLAKIEGHYAPNGIEVLASTGYDTSELSFVPLFVVLDANGEYAAEMLSTDLITGLQVRSDSGEEYRGYDRRILLGELQALRKAAMRGRE